MLSGVELFSAWILPAAATGAILLAGWRLTRSWNSARDSRSWVAPVATSAGFAAGFLALFGWTGLPPRDAIDWLLPLTVPLAALGLLESYARLPPPSAVLAIGAAVSGSLMLLAWPLIGAAGHDWLPWALLSATTLAVVVLVLTGALAQRLSFGRFSTVLLAATAPAAVVLGCSGSARLGMIAAVLASTQIGAIGAGIVLGRAAVARGVTVVWGALLAGLLWSGYLYASLNVSDALLLAAAPCCAWLGRWAPRRYGWLVNFGTQVGAVLLVAGVAALRAWQEFSKAQW